MKKNLSLLLALALVLALMAGCGSQSAGSPAEGTDAQESVSAPAENKSPDAEAVESPADAESSEVEGPEAVEAYEEPEVESALPEDYPMIAPEGMTLTAFQSINPNLSDLINDYGDLPWWQEVAARTGITFDWHMASFASVEEQFNLLIAANDLCNLNMAGMYYSDGITAAVENDIFVDIAPYLDEYAPDYKRLTMQDHVRPVVYDENGSMIAFYELGMEEFTPNNGVLIRSDLLEEQGLDIPVTYDQYEDTLLSLQKAYDIPGAIYLYPDNTAWISGGKGVKDNFSLSDSGDAMFGPVEEDYREYLKIMNRWYDEGLIYKDFYVIPEGQNINYMISQMSSGESVCTFTYCEFASMIQLNEGEKLVAGYLPRDNEDDSVHLTDGIDALVATVKAYMLGPNSSEEEIQAMCMMMNYFYTDEGALLANYGVEGQSFEYRDDGTPWYTDLIVNNPDGLSQTQALCFYIGYMVPCSSDYTKYNISSLTTWADFVDAWGAADNAWDMPQVTLTPDEQEEYSALMSDIKTYMDENLVKFIIGDLDPNSDSDWNSYIDAMENLGVDTCVEIYRDALERFRAA